MKTIADVAEVAKRLQVATDQLNRKIELWSDLIRDTGIAIQATVPLETGSAVLTWGRHNRGWGLTIVLADGTRRPIKEASRQERVAACAALPALLAELVDVGESLIEGLEEAVEAKTDET
jgi:hypothetical protein